jgi:hypothetical protein
VGLNNLVVVHTKHATLICHRDAAQRIKDVHAEIREVFGDDYV